MMPKHIACLFIALSCLLNMGPVARAFDIRRHLATKTRYAFRVPIKDAPSIYTMPDPENFQPVHMWMLSRHGTRWPTSTRMAQINTLEHLFKDATNLEDYPWLKKWQSPIHRMSFAGGELHHIGEDEMWALAYRLRKRFPSLVDQPYFPKRYPVVSTQVSRAAASASAFTSGFFPSVTPNPDEHHVATEVAAMSRKMLASSQKADSHGLLAFNHDSVSSRASRPQAVAITMAPKNNDTLLRFYDVCPAYAEHRLRTDEWLASWMLGYWATLVPKLEQRLKMTRSIDPCEVEAVWQLCLLEAGLYNNVGGACALFDQEDVHLLEWLDDVSLLESHGYGAGVNFKIAAPLLHDALSTINAKAQDSDRIQNARLLFAHCETLVPLASLMGLFEPPGLREHQASTKDTVHNERWAQLAQAVVSGVDATEDIEALLVQGQGLVAGGEDISVCSKSGAVKPGLPPPPGWKPVPEKSDDRTWRGSQISPFGANMQLVLYRANNSSATLANHKVRLIYNEQVIPIPGCSSSSNSSSVDCDLEEFLDIMHQRANPATLQTTCQKSPAPAITAAAA